MRRLWVGIALGAAAVIVTGSVAAAAASGRSAGPGAVTGPRSHAPMMNTSLAPMNRAGTPGTPGPGMMGGAGTGTAGPGGNTMMGGGAGGIGSGMMGNAGGMGGSGMTGHLWLAGNGTKVTSIAAARARAATAATRAGLRTGEVIWFDNGFYVELKDASGASATEVIVNPTTGAVTTEPGPAMMWNTRYGTHHATGPTKVSAVQAQQVATAWLAANLPGRAADPPDAYPGYYTLETTSNGAIDGMLSVNASTGQVWYHSWHGHFIAREDS